MSSTGSKQSWNTRQYAQTGRFVSTLGLAVVQLLDPQQQEHILDLGCGDGALTEALLTTGATVVGVDASPAMLAAARERGLNVREMSGDALTFQEEFDAVFSNAALHWMANAEDVIAGVARALKPGGRFVAEMGGLGNIAAIRVALQAVLQKYGVDAEQAAQSFFPAAAHYQSLLEAAGFRVEYMEIIPRPTPLPAGMDAWLETFRNGVLDLLQEPARSAAKMEILALLQPVLCDANGNWVADYVRLRFKAIRKETAPD
ncbi:MAG: class I SAM-dependent methyltransferase [Acidobacteriaceae bacterium]